MFLCSDDVCEMINKLLWHFHKKKKKKNSEGTCSCCQWFSGKRIWSMYCMLIISFSVFKYRLNWFYTLKTLFSKLSHMHFSAIPCRTSKVYQLIKNFTEILWSKFCSCLTDFHFRVQEVLSLFAVIRHPALLMNVFHILWKRHKGQTLLPSFPGCSFFIWLFP